jgi:hypothetical protein
MLNTESRKRDFWAKESHFAEGFNPILALQDLAKIATETVQVFWDPSGVIQNENCLR